MRKYRGAKITSFTEGDRQLLRRGTVQCALLHNELMLQFESLQEDSVLCTGEGANSIFKNDRVTNPVREPERLPR